MNPANLSKDRVFDLMCAFIDDRLDENDLAELSNCLRSDQARRRQFAVLLLQEVQLREIAKLETAAAAVTRQSPLILPIARLEAGFWRLLAVMRRRRLHFFASLGIALAALAVFWLLVGVLWPSTPILSSIAGQVLIERNGQQRFAKTGDRLLAGDWLLLEPGARSVVRYGAEDTLLRLSGSARLHVEHSADGKEFSLETGLISAVIAPQPERHPLRILTPRAEVIVLGTELELKATPELTRLEVWKGRVRLTDRGDGTSAGINEGELGLVRKGSPLMRATIRHGVVRDYWLGDRQGSLTNLASLVDSAGEPTGWTLLTDFDAPTNWADRYLVRARTFLRPPVTGYYQFWVAADDQAELWLSQDSNPDKKVKVCWTPEWTAPQDWDKHREQQSSLIFLEAGQKYYLEALHSERAGGDCLSVAWLVPGSQRQIISGRYLAPSPIKDGEEPQ